MTRADVRVHRMRPTRLHLATRRVMCCGDTTQATETTMSMAGKLEQRESECEALRRAVTRLESAATEAGDETPNAAAVAVQEEAAHALHALQLQCDQTATEVRRRRRYTQRRPSSLGLLVCEPAAE